LIEQEKSNTHKNLFTHLLNSPNLTVKFVLLGILSCTIFFIPGDGTFLNSDNTAYAHFWRRDCQYRRLSDSLFG
jgi:hypothetical protein